MIFDALVVGETPSAMFAAALLVRKGLKVAWVISPGYFLRSEGEKNPKAPDVAWNLLPQTLVRSILQRLGVPFKHLEKEENTGVGIQIVSPEFRTSILDGVSEFRSELKRIFGLKELELDRIIKQELEDSAQEFLSKYWKLLPQVTPKGKRRSISLFSCGEGVRLHHLSIEGVHLEPGLRRLIELIAFSQSYLFQWVFPRSLVRHFLYNACHVNIFAQGSLVSPEEIFWEVFQMGGGKLFYTGKEVYLEAHRERGVSLWMGDEEVVNGTICLVAVSPDESPEMFERLDFHHVLRELSEPVRLANITFTIDEMGIPGGMGENLILYTGKVKDPFDPEELAFLMLEASEAGTFVGHYTVFYNEELLDMSDEGLRPWANRQIVRLEKLFPFMTSHITPEKIFISRGHPLSLGPYFYETTRKRKLGVAKQKEGFMGKNIRYIGRDQLDYLGLEGEILTGLQSVRWAMDRLARI